MTAEQILLLFMQKLVRIWKEPSNCIRDAGVKVGVSIKPATPVNDISHLLEDVDMVLVMTVQPGFGGQKYIPECTEKIAGTERTDRQRRIWMWIFR